MDETPFINNTCRVTSPRLATQGFINLHRKLFLRLLIVAIGIYLICVPNPWELTEIGLRFVEIGGSILIFAGILGRTLATISIGDHKDSKIVNTEFYSICRNPLYFSSFLMATGIGMISGRLDFTLMLMTGYLAVFYPMMLNEAKYLRGNFKGFAEYEAKVPLFFPNPRLWVERKKFEINFKLVKRTLFDASVALLVFPVMILIRTYL